MLASGAGAGIRQLGYPPAKMRVRAAVQPCEACGFGTFTR